MEIILENVNRGGFTSCAPDFYELSKSPFSFFSALVANFSQSGTYTFNGMITGAAIADLLTGRMNQFSHGVGQYLDAFNNFIGVYAQDNFRAGRRLTINAGLRYEPYFPWHDQWNRVDVFRLDAYRAGVHSAVISNALPGELVPGDAGVPSNGTAGAYRISRRAWGSHTTSPEKTRRRCAVESACFTIRRRWARACFRTPCSFPGNPRST